MISNKNKAFTLVETLVVMIVIVILSLVVLPNYTSIRQQLAFQRSVSKLVQEIRVIQEMAMSAQEIECEIPLSGCGYGIYLRVAPLPFPQISYALYVDKNNNYICDGCQGDGGEFIERIFFEGGIKTKRLLMADGTKVNHINIIFAPSDPTTFLTDNDGIDLGDQISIVISLISDETETKTITVNKAGLVDID